MRILKLLLVLTTVLGACALVYQPAANRNDIPNRLPEAAPYNLEEARTLPPPYEDQWAGESNPGQCRNCHQRIFDEWNGSMMSNAWRDPAWRAAYLLLSRAVSANGECDTPEPPDGTEKAAHNPFANPGECSSAFNIGAEKYTVSRPGSLLDGFCSRCHMPTNYADNFAVRNIKLDPKTGMENALLDPKFFPSSDNGTGIAFATLEAQHRNTDSGKSGIICAVCHTMAETRDTPFHNYDSSKSTYAPALGPGARADFVAKDKQDTFQVPDPGAQNLGYSIGAGSYRFSPNAIVNSERFGPMVAGTPPASLDTYTGGVFQQDFAYQQIDSSKHKGFHQVMFTRSEMCAACHDVTNALPIKNSQGKWVGGFPIERTYTEWANSAYADRPGNKNFDPSLKRDCQTCHMQQEYGQAGTAQTLYDKNGRPLPPLMAPVATNGKRRPFLSHHFVGGNAYITRMVGKDVEDSGSPAAYPELSAFSFSSSDHKSVYSRAFFTHTERGGAYAQQQRLAWDRLRHVLWMDLRGPATADAGAIPISISVQNTGSGHKFPTGFPEGRIAWLAVHAYDLATGRELQIHDSVWSRDSRGFGNLTREDIVDPNYPGCNWRIPAGSPDPYSYQFKAVATLGDGCPTLDLPYATPLNLSVDRKGLPIDKDGKPIDPSNPGMEVFKDVNGDGDHFDDSFLRDTRIRPRGNAGNVVEINRYSVIVPPGTRGPVAVTSAVYYQTFEAIAALKFLGNLADTNNNFVLEPCVLGGLCDGRTPSTEPAAVEGAPPVAMVVRNWVININGSPGDTTPLRIITYPQSGADQVYQDPVIKAFFSKPVLGVNDKTFTLTDSEGKLVPSWVEQVGDGAWGLFAHQVLLTRGKKYVARLKAGICDFSKNCTASDTIWSFIVAKTHEAGRGDTSIPMGFPRELPGQRGGRFTGAGTGNGVSATNVSSAKMR
ncbi:MAG TPA: Ig-like domain-containing protein [Candidatus Angelobacter sp.]|nr:Ig-like domain-containing protein [Candidatus Angelobacter sp.]